MSNDFDDFFADNPSFSPVEPSDNFFKTEISLNASYKTENTNTPKEDDFGWFIDNPGTYEDNSSEQGTYAGGDDWFFSSSSSSENRITRSTFDDIILATRNGGARQVMTSLSNFTGTLARMGVPGPMLFKPLNLDARGKVIGVGSQFTVFIDGLGFMTDRVMKRVNKIVVDPDVADISGDERLRAHFRTLELEVLSLCHPPLRDHRNIVNLIGWGYDYPNPDPMDWLPVLLMERAMCSLSEFLQNDSISGEIRPSWENKHQLCLDVAEGLAALHSHGIVHGDVKPDNVLIFKQENSKVPYLGKLSDFGVCISMEESHTLSFRSYLGTLGWIPSEVIEYREDLHGPFSPELLLKCDSFSYGMLVLSVLLTGGRSPFADLEEEEEEESPSEKAMGLIFANEDESLPGPLKSKLMGLSSTLLGERPQDRASLSHDLLNDDSKGYHNWIFAREVAKKKGIVKVDGRKSMKYNKGLSYWIGLDYRVLTQLEQLYLDLDKSGPAFDSETLFGMGIRYTTRRNAESAEKIRAYIGAAAKGSYIPAQAIIGRLYEAHEKSLAIIADEKLAETWLFNAASTGSFIAAEDLARHNPVLLKKAKASFRKAGGYNGGFAELSAIEDKFLNLNLAMARKLCDKKGNLESLVDLDGNRLLHIAAMFDKIDVINYLVGERGADINSQNDRGETPIYKACLSGHHSAVEVLIALSADASIPEKQFGISPLHWLFNFEEQHIPHIAQLLITEGKAKVDVTTASVMSQKYEIHIPFTHFPFHWPFGTPLHWAASTRSFTAVDALLDYGADINAVDSPRAIDAQTTFAMAARRGDSEMVKYLLRRGADAKIIDGYRRNPFHMMAISNHVSTRLLKLWEGFENWVNHGPLENHLREIRECVLALQRSGGDLDGQRGPGSGRNTALIDASNAGNCAVALALLDAGANANCYEYLSEKYPLFIWTAFEKRGAAYPEIFPTLYKRLMKHTEDLTRTANDGDSLIHQAIRTGSSLGVDEDVEERIRILMSQEHPPDINAIDRNDATPLLLALTSRARESATSRCQMLLRFGARVDPKADGYSGGFIDTICHNNSLTDSESLYLLKLLLSGFTEDEKRQMARSAISHRYGSTVVPLVGAVRGGKYFCVKYLLDLGVDPDVITGRATALDWALDRGEILRRQFLDSLMESFAPDQRKEAIIKGSVFDLVSYQDVETMNGGDYLTREKYFAQPKIINHLISIGAKRARELTDDYGRTEHPSEWDVEFAANYGEWYNAKTQPHYETWKVLYQFPQ